MKTQSWSFGEEANKKVGSERYFSYSIQYDSGYFDSSNNPDRMRLMEENENAELIPDIVSSLDEFHFQKSKYRLPSQVFKSIIEEVKSYHYDTKKSDQAKKELNIKSWKRSAEKHKENMIQLMTDWYWWEGQYLDYAREITREDEQQQSSRRMYWSKQVLPETETTLYKKHGRTTDERKPLIIDLSAVPVVEKPSVEKTSPSFSDVLQKKIDQMAKQQGQSVDAMKEFAKEHIIVGSVAPVVSEAPKYELDADVKKLIDFLNSTATNSEKTKMWNEGEYDDESNIVIASRNRLVKGIGDTLWMIMSHQSYDSVVHMGSESKLKFDGNDLFRAIKRELNKNGITLDSSIMSEPKSEDNFIHRVYIVHKDGSPNTEFEDLTADQAAVKYNEFLEHPNTAIISWDKRIYNKAGFVIKDVTVKMQAYKDEEPKPVEEMKYDDKSKAEAEAEAMIMILELEAQSGGWFKEEKKDEEPITVTLTSNDSGGMFQGQNFTFAQDTISGKSWQGKKIVLNVKNKRGTLYIESVEGADVLSYYVIVGGERVYFNNGKLTIKDVQKKTFEDGGSIRKYGKDSVRSIIKNEGILYAIRDYMDSDAINRDELELIKYWDDAQSKINAFEESMQIQGYNPGVLVHNSNGFLIIAEESGNEIPVSQLSVEDQKVVSEIQEVLFKILDYVGISRDDFSADKYEDGGLISDSEKIEKKIRTFEILLKTTKDKSEKANIQKKLNVFRILQKSKPSEPEQESNSFIIPESIKENFKIEGDLSNIKNWKAKILAANSTTEGMKKGDFEDVGYVAISLKDNTIIPIARSDEHQTGYELLQDYYKSKKKIDVSDYVTVFCLVGSTNYIYDDNSGYSDLKEKYEALKKAYSYGLKNSNVKFSGGKFDRKEMSIKDFLEGNGDYNKAIEVKKEKGEISELGADLIDYLERMAVLIHRYYENEKNFRDTDKIKEQVFELAEEFNKFLILKLPDDLIDYKIRSKFSSAIESRDFSALEQSLFSFNGIKNSIHNLLRKKGLVKTVRIAVDFFMNPEVAMEEFNRLSNIGTESKPISEEAKSIIKPEFDKMQDFIKEMDEKLANDVAYIRATSHRSADKLKREGIATKCKANMYEGQFYEISKSDLERALKIKGIKKFNPKHESINCMTSSVASNPVEEKKDKKKLQEYVDTITFDELYKGAEIPNEFYDAYNAFLKTGEFEYTDDVAKYFSTELGLTDIDKLKTIAYWVSENRKKMDAGKEIEKMISDGWQVLSTNENLEKLAKSGETITLDEKIKGNNKFKIIAGKDGKYYMQAPKQKKNAYSPYSGNPMYPFFFKIENK